MARRFKMFVTTMVMALMMAIPFAAFANEADQERDSMWMQIFGQVYETAGKAGYEESTLNPESLISNSIQRILNWTVGLLGVIATLLIIYSGYLWMTAGGDDGQIDKAKSIIKQVVVGFIVLSLAYGIVTFVFGIISKASPSTQQQGQSTNSGTGGNG